MPLPRDPRFHATSAGSRPCRRWNPLVAVAGRTRGDSGTEGDARWEKVITGVLHIVASLLAPFVALPLLRS